MQIKNVLKVREKPSRHTYILEYALYLYLLNAISAMQPFDQKLISEPLVS